MELKSFVRKEENGNENEEKSRKNFTIIFVE